MTFTNIYPVTIRKHAKIIISDPFIISVEPIDRFIPAAARRFRSPPISLSRSSIARPRARTHTQGDFIEE
ncbi:hypothetical protein AKJ16_DCAP01717 [Drosera capensis]